MQILRAAYRLSVIATKIFFRRYLDFWRLFVCIKKGRVHQSTVFLSIPIFKTPNPNILVGKNVRIGRNVTFNCGSGGKIIIEEKVQLGSEIKLSAGPNQTIFIGKNSRLVGPSIVSGNIEIERDCVLAPNTHLISNHHKVDLSNHTLDESDALFGMIQGQIKLGERCFVGANNIIFGPITIHPASFLKANNRWKKNECSS